MGGVVSGDSPNTAERRPRLTARLETASDEELVRRARDDDPDATAELYRRYVPSLIRICSRYGPGPQAEDLAHDTFEKFLTNLSTLDDPTKVGNWLKRVARNGAIDRCRGAAYQRETRWSAALGMETEAADDSVESTVERRAALRAILGGIRPVDAALLSDHYLEDLSIADVATRHGSTEGSTKVRLLRSRRSARQFAEASGWRGLIPLPVHRWVKTLTSYAEPWSVGATLASLIAGMALTLHPAAVPAAGSQQRADVPAVTPTVGVEAGMPAVPRVPTDDVLRLDDGAHVHRPGRRAVEKAPQRAERRRLLETEPVAIPGTGRRVNERLDGPPDYEIGVREPATGASVWIAIEDEPEAEQPAEAVCLVAEQPTLPTYCDRKP